MLFATIGKLFFQKVFYLNSFTFHEAWQHSLQCVFLLHIQYTNIDPEIPLNFNCKKNQSYVSVTTAASEDG